MELFTYFLFLLSILKCVLSSEEKNVLSHDNNFSVKAYIKKDTNENNRKIQLVEYFEKIALDFSDDINSTKEVVKNLFLDIEASFEELSDDVAKNVSMYNYGTEEKLNVLDGLINEFIENNKGIIFNSSDEEKKIAKKKFKKMCDLILGKLKVAVELCVINNYRILLKYGKGDRKKEALDRVKNDDNISDELKKELLKYENLENKDANVSELINFITPIYESFMNKLNALIREVSVDINEILQ
ncbi:sporozoite protein essential for cell traversal [Plasmodium gonderi]|uniref:Sporozoite protein essential for cell traversal n=1 Tax=Plasmodium gonderi TaxID=77519 RepID=A0A1Y1JIV0_PLAGO|nr:sporozoite protein essential for cell traversal [Plasmodium gonderi]GAW82150.1 sporozoite protein essential for cell traversal [Plasmodium gonderi]